MLSFHKHIIVRAPRYPVNKSVDLDKMVEAIYLASNVVYSELKKTQNVNYSKKEEQKLNISIYKYKARATHRCTPFGLFAGLFLCSWDENSSVILPNENAFERKTRLDMNIVCEVANVLEQHLSISPYLRYYPNNSLYRIANCWRYVESKIVNNQKKYTLSQVNNNEYIELILNECSKGLSYHELSTLLTEKQFDEEEVNAFLRDIINNDLIVSDLEPNVTGTEFFDIILNKCEDIFSITEDKNILPIITSLKNIKEAISELDLSQIYDENKYDRVIKLVKGFLPSVNKTNILQSDLFIRPLSAKISSSIQNKLLTTINFINKITPNVENQRLVDFRKRFYDRYEDYEVPLLVALDCETGVGYPNIDGNGINPLVDDIEEKSVSVKKIEWDSLQSCLHSVIISAIKKGKSVVEITDEDFEGINHFTSNLPHTMTVMFKIHDSTLKQIEFVGAGGCSAINLVSRFGNAKEEIRKLIEELAIFEENKQSGKIIAEIIHLPETRTGNILSRPLIRSYEIPYLAAAGVNKSNIISLSDIMISIRNDKIILRSKRLNKEIIPRLSNAHNYSYKSLSAYHFLCDMQGQYFDKTFFSFNWGVLEKEFVYLPRVVYKGVIIKRARWFFKRKDYAAIIESKSEKEMLEKFQYFVSQYQLPKQFLFSEGDNELFIEVDNQIAIATFIDILKKHSEITINEYLMESDNPLIKDMSNNTYVNECIGIIKNESEKTNDEALMKNLNYEMDANSIKTIGDNWVYYKLYCGVKTGDALLTEYIKPIVENLYQTNLIEKWFFIRYSDPSFHLRIRFLLHTDKAFEEVINQLNKKLQPLLVNGMISKMQLDTYKREMKRYGYGTIKHAETIFHSDSDFVLKILSLLDNEEGHEWRWKIAILSIDKYLDDFHISEIQKVELYEKLSDLFFKENLNDKGIKIVLDNKYRESAKEIEKILNTEREKIEEVEPVIDLLLKRSEFNSRIINELLVFHKEKSLEVELDNLLSSLLHMSLNRMFMGRNRMNEFVVYYFLSKYYRSKAKRVLFQPLNVKS